MLGDSRITDRRHLLWVIGIILGVGGVALRHALPRGRELLPYMEFLLIAVPLIVSGLYLFLARDIILKRIKEMAGIKNYSSPEITRVLKRNWDVILILLLVSLLFLYRLQTWNIIRLEEWRRYVQFIDGNWLLYRTQHKLNTIFLPTFLIASLFPFDHVLEYRFVTAGLSILGGGLFYVAIRRAAKSKLVAALATAVVATHTWILLFGKMFFVSWSALTLSSLTLLIFISLREHGGKAAAIISGISILNFAQAVYFVFPFLTMERLHARHTLSLKQVVFALLLITILLVPAFFLFLAEQPRRVDEEHAIYGDDLVAEITIPWIDKQIYWPFGVSQTFRAFHDYLSITKGPREYATFDVRNRYSLIAILLLMYPVLALKLSRWEYRHFFAGSALFSLATMVVFPMTVNVSYTWAFFLFLAPLLAEGAVKNPHKLFRAFSLLLLVTVIAVQGVDSVEDILLYDAVGDFDERIGPHVENQTFLVGDEVPAIVENSPLNLLDGYDYVPVDSCPAIRESELPAVVADPFCASPDKTLVAETRMLFLYN